MIATVVRLVIDEGEGILFTCSRRPVAPLAQTLRFLCWLVITGVSPYQLIKVRIVSLAMVYIATMQMVAAEM